MGAFAERNLVVLPFGALGWMMVRLDWPRPPLMLGPVLGPLAENKLFLSTDNHGAAWLLRPAPLGLLAVILTGVGLPIWSDLTFLTACGRRPTMGYL